ncbi:MAG: tetratricopeptide repeat protein [Candidatus Hodarchaeota archaeon]
MSDKKPKNSIRMRIRKLIKSIPLDSPSIDQAEQLINESKFDEALQIIEKFEKKKLTSSDQFSCLFLKGTIMNKKGQFEEAIKLANHILQEATEIENVIEILDAIALRSEALIRLGKLNESLEELIRGERILKDRGSDQLEFVQREAALLNLKGLNYWLKGNFDQALGFFQQCLVLRKKVGNKNEIASALNNLGITYTRKGDLDQGLTYFQQALTLYKELGNTQNIARALNNLGNINMDIGDLDQALDYHQQSLVLIRKLGNKQEIASSLNNIGWIYKLKGDFHLALEYSHRALTLKEEIKNLQQIAESLINLSNIYLEKGELDQALEYCQRGLVLYEKVGNKQEIARSLHNIGEIYGQKGSLDQALEHFKQSLRLREEVGNNFHTAETLFHLVSVGMDKMTSEESQGYLDKLKEINEKEKNKVIRQRYRVAEALVLKKSARARNRVKAEELLEQVAGEDCRS